MSSEGHPQKEPVVWARTARSNGGRSRTLPRRGHPSPTTAMDQDEARTTMLVRETLQLRPPVNSAPKMRNNDRATDDEPDRKRLENLGSGDALLGAASEMIRDAVITPQHERCDEAEQLLGPDVERAGLVGAGVEREEPVDDKVPFVQNLDVQTLAELDELIERSNMLVRSVIAALNRR